MCYLASMERKGNEEEPRMSPFLAGVGLALQINAVVSGGKPGVQIEERVRVAGVVRFVSDMKELEMRGTLGLIVLIILVVIALRFFGII